uniref:CotH kinase family protein n=1 Tax=Flavobacterium sp. TaxID=239 RepID=UPI0040492C68
MKSIISVVFILFSTFCLGQQTILTDSNLPILVITTDIDPSTNSPYEIPDDPKVPANLKLIFRPDGSRNYLTDISNSNFLDYDGKIGIELRGSSSQALDKKPYGFTTRLDDNISNNNVSLLGMPSENDWVLNSLAFDPSMMRDFLSYTLARNMGNYAPRVKYVEVIVNDDYKGLYILTEKIKIDGDRIDLVKLTNTDNAQPEISGGYIIKSDKLTGGDVVAWSMPSYSGWNTNFLHDSPKTENITFAQDNYIESVFGSLASKTNPANPSITNGYPTVIDIPSFIDYMLMIELASNADSYVYSTYFHKDRNGKLRAGPVWDFNLTFGNDIFIWDYDRSLYDIWQFEYNNENVGPKFWRDLFYNPNYRCYFAKRWFELTETNEPLHYETIENLIDETVNLLAESQIREQTRWGLVDTHVENVAEMKIWIQNRISWINSHIGSSANCENVSTPALVISRIHYNPLDDDGFVSKDLEFIEITNHTNQTVNLTGFYIKELGISYQFPVNSMIQANQRIYLCSNSTAFSNYYGISAFGQFTRNLSNKSYHIVLSDAFGNIIDEVNYEDDLPWPSEADGDGPFLQLVSLNSDNSLASNWMASSETLANDAVLSLNANVIVCPNPTNGLVQFKFTTTQFNNLECRIFNNLGQNMGIFQLDSNDTTLDLSYLNSGMYFYTITHENKTILQDKIIKR